MIGDLSLAPPSLQAAAARLMAGSRESGPTRAVVNICFPYTSSQELQHAADEICGGLGASFLLQHDVRPSLLHRVMHTKVRGGGRGFGRGGGGGFVACPGAYPGSIECNEALREWCNLYFA